MECKIIRTRTKCNDYTVTLKGMTRGAILALRHALVAHSGAGSAVAGDILAFLDHAIRSSGDPEVGRAVIDAPHIAGEVMSVACVVPGPPSTMRVPTVPV